MRKKNIYDYMQSANVTRCEYCGKEKDGLTFFIGASTEPDWVLVEGTGKMTCPDCYDKAMAEGAERIENHIRTVNNQVSRGGAAQ